jgi:indole-3-acetate monooxygenase
LQPETARRLFGAPEAVLAWGAGIQGKAVAAPGGYRVTGSWSFGSGSRHATLLGAHSWVVEADGTPRLRANGRPADRTALFARSKAIVDDVWQVVGLRGTGSDTFEVRDLFVPGDETIDREALEEIQVRTPAYAMTTSQAYAAAFGGLMLGIARGALTDLTKLAMTKTPRGASSSLRENPVFQTQLARMEARHRAARAYHLQTLRDAWSDVECTGALSMEHRTNIRLAATHTISEGVELVVEAYRAAGQTAIFLENPFERRLRDALSASQQAQGRPTHYTTVGRLLLGLPPDTLMFM